MNDLDEELARLSGLTQNIAPRVDFAARVENAIHLSRRPSLWTELGAFAKPFSFAAAIAVVASIGFAVQSSNSFENAVQERSAEEMDSPW